MEQSPSCAQHALGNHPQATDWAQGAEALTTPPWPGPEADNTEGVSAMRRRELSAQDKDSAGRASEGPEGG